MAMVKTLYVALLLSLLMVSPVLAVTKGNLEVSLMDSEAFYSKTGVKYESECLTCHLPLKFIWHGSNMNLARSDLKYYKENLEGEDFVSITMKYLKNESYYGSEWTPNNFCNATTWFNGIEETNCYDKGYYQIVEKWRLVWDSLPSLIPIKTDKVYYIDIIATRNANNKGSVDIIPEIKGVLFPEFAWFNNSWNLTKPIYIWTDSGTAEQNYPYAVNVTYSSYMQADFDDLRFTTNDNTTELDFWVEEKKNSVWAYVWLNITSNLTTSNTTIWMWYNNTGAASTSSGANTFSFFDDFSGNLDAWTINSGTWEIVGGELLGSLTTGSEAGIWTDDSVVNNSRIRTRAKRIASTQLKLISRLANANQFYRHGFLSTGQDMYKYSSGWTLINNTGNGAIAQNTWYLMDVTLDGNDMEMTLNGTTHLIGTDAAYTTGKMGVATNVDDNVSLDWVFVGKFEDLAFNHVFGAEEGQPAGIGQPPLWSSPANSFPANYLSGTKSTFNITFANGSASEPVNTTNMSLLANWSGSEVEYTMTLISGDQWSGVYGYEVVLGADQYQWRFRGLNNESPPQANTTGLYNDSIAQASQTCSNAFSPSSPITYPTNVTDTCTCSETGTVKLYRNDSDVTGTENNTAADLGVDVYEYICNSTGNANFSTATDTDYYTINIADNQINMFIDGNQNQNASSSFGSELNVTITQTCPSGTTVNLYRNGSLENSSATLSTYTLNSSEGSGSLLLFKGNATGNANCTANATGQSFNVSVQSTLTIIVKNEKTNQTVTFNVTTLNGTDTFTETNLTTFTANGTNVAYGDITIKYSSYNSTFPERKRYMLLNNTSTATLIQYSLSVADGQYVSFSIIDSSGNPVNNVLVTASRLLSGSWRTVDQEKSDATGIAELFLDPLYQYMFVFNKTNYNTINTNITPSQSQYIVRLTSSTVEKGNFTPNAWVNLTYNMNPSGGTVRNESTTFNLTILSSSGDLEWFGMNITYGNGTVAVSNNTTGAGGESVNFTINLTGEDGINITVLTYFKRTNFTLQTRSHRYFVRGISGRGLKYALDYLEGAIDPFSLGMLAILSAMSVAGLATSKKSPFFKMGGGLLIVGTMAIFTYVFENTLWGWGIWSFSLLAVLSYMFTKGRL